MVSTNVSSCVMMISWKLLWARLGEEKRSREEREKEREQAERATKGQRA